MVESISQGLTHSASSQAPLSPALFLTLAWVWDTGQLTLSCASWQCAPPKTQKSGCRIGISWMVLTVFSAHGIPWHRLLCDATPRHPHNLVESVFPGPLLQILFHPFIAGLIFGCGSMAIMSTLSSQADRVPSRLVETPWHLLLKEGSRRQVPVVSRLQAWQSWHWPCPMKPQQLHSCSWSHSAWAASWFGIRPTLFYSPLLA